MTTTSEQFVKAWQSSSSIKEVANKLGLSSNNVSNRAAYYRKKGVRLKIMPRRFGGPRIDIEALNKLCDPSQESHGQGG
ncbi:hypothetical protein LCGC14_3066570 [marine sediment metagenome]|uniref:Uncharacterized protein n=1 Tax=marine sediment metagenome TaxID=412755 RepID=A0A0F8YQ15_9ZZZZ